jgi:excisionase family DNA binding protein
MMPLFVPRIAHNNERVKLITVKKTCERLGIGRSHLWCLIRSGKIRTVRIGKRGVRIPESEIDRFIQEGLMASQWDQEGR